MKHDSLQCCTDLLTHLGNRIEVVRCYVTKVEYRYEKASISFFVNLGPTYQSIRFRWSCSSSWNMIVTTNT